jgi:abortive infection bacteriophage resistance protein
LGGILYLFDGSPVDVRTKIAAHFQLPHPVMSSWLLTLNTARNVCAHHGRFWNRAIGAPPMLPPLKRYEWWYKPVEIFPPFVKGSIRPTAFVILSICNHMLSEIAPGCGWANKVKALLDEHPQIRRSSMGFPDNWIASPVWHDL